MHISILMLLFISIMKALGCTTLENCCMVRGLTVLHWKPNIVQPLCICGDLHVWSSVHNVQSVKWQHKEAFLAGFCAYILTWNMEQNCSYMFFFLCGSLSWNSTAHDCLQASLIENYG